MGRRLQEVLANLGAPLRQQRRQVRLARLDDRQEPPPHRPALADPHPPARRRLRAT